MIYATKKNCLATINPKVAKLWHPTKNGKLTPFDVTPSSTIDAYWECENGHEWFKRISEQNRFSRCEQCNSLAFNNPELIKEWHPTKNGKLTPWDVSRASNKKIWWIDEKGHVWEAKVKSRSYKARPTGCPYCSIPRNRVCIDNCLATEYPSLISEWHPTKNGKITPYDVLSFSHEKFWWICKNGHEWISTVRNRSNGRGCPFCRMIILKDGTKWDSIPEAYMYLKYRKMGLKMMFHGLYGGKMGRCKYDFYFPDQNKYVEITSYPKTTKYLSSYMMKIVCEYNKIISKKKKYVEKDLGANFELIRFIPTMRQANLVKRNSK